MASGYARHATTNGTRRSAKALALLFDEAVLAV